MFNHRLPGVPFRAAAPHAHKDGFVVGDAAFLGSRNLPRNKLKQQHQSALLLWLCSAATFVSAGWEMGLGGPFPAVSLG